MRVCDGTACGGRKRGSRSQSWLGTERSVRSCTRQAQGAWGGGDAGHLFVGWVISGWEFTDEQNTKKKKAKTNCLESCSDPDVVGLKLTQFGCLLKIKNIHLPHFCKSDKNRRLCQP